MQAHQDHPWTMARFIEWTFGPRPVFDTARRVYEVGVLVERVLVSPEEEEPRRALLQRLAHVRDAADHHFWWEEGNAVAMMLRALRGAADPGHLARRLRAGAYALEQLVRSRLAKAVVLQLRQPAESAA